MRKILLLSIFSFTICFSVAAQLKWTNVDSLFQPLPSSVHVYFTNQPLDDTSKFRAYYLIADLKDKKLDFTVDTAHDRRLIPSVFYERNNKPLMVVNCTFFSYETNRSLNTVIKNGKLVAFNNHTIIGRGKDTLTYLHPLASAFGIDKKGRADVAWTYADSTLPSVYAVQKAKTPTRDSIKYLNLDSAQHYASMVGQFNNNPGNVKLTYEMGDLSPLKIWKMHTAVGGGPVLIQNGEIDISNNKELKFPGKAINDKHPRTAMGYTQDGKLIVLVIEGRNKVAGGATLTQEAQIFKDLGCWEALNLDGGGSSCMLVNGKETIKISDAAGQRSVPAVFIIRQK